MNQLPDQQPWNIINEVHAIMLDHQPSKYFTTKYNTETQAHWIEPRKRRFETSRRIFQTESSIDSKFTTPSSDLINRQLI